MSLDEKTRIYIRNRHLDGSMFVRYYMNRVMGKNVKDHDDVLGELLKYYTDHEKIEPKLKSTVDDGYISDKSSPSNSSIRLSNMDKRDLDSIKHDLELFKKKKLSHTDVVRHLIASYLSNSEKLRELDNQAKEYKKRILDSQEIPFKRQSFIKHRLPNGKIYGED